uniref:Uncharacterized protein n=1 Tax=Stegastes partitus TaxID=144197 RepID=A0A3B5BK22_9TELE
ISCNHYRSCFFAAKKIRTDSDLLNSFTLKSAPKKKWADRQFRKKINKLISPVSPQPVEADGHLSQACLCLFSLVPSHRCRLLAQRESKGTSPAPTRGKNKKLLLAPLQCTHSH